MNRKIRNIKNARRRQGKKASYSIFLTVIFLFAFSFLLFTQNVFAEEGYTIKGGVSLDKVPKELYGTWRVKASLISTNTQGRFKSGSTDLWNLSRAKDVLTLDNPFSGAHASITVNEVRGRLIKFEKSQTDTDKKLTDVVELNLGKDTFTGINRLKLDTVSADGHVIKTETASYNLVGEKISGQSIK